MKNPARYIIRASFSQERMQYLDQEGALVFPVLPFNARFRMEISKII